MNDPKERRHCTVCGKEFDEWATQENFGMDHYCNYGSKHDEEHIKIDMCCSCFEKLMDFVIPRCRQNPFENREYSYIKEFNEEETNRLDRIFTVIGKTKLDRITDGVCFTGDIPAYLDVIEKELKEEGYDLDSIPVIKGSHRRSIIESLRKGLEERKAEEGLKGNVEGTQC